MVPLRADAALNARVGTFPASVADMPFLIAAIGIAFVAAIMDWRTGNIPNWLTYGALVLFPPLHAVHAGLLGGSMRQVLTTAGMSLLGAALCGLLPLLLWFKRVCGGGDVKLFAALGAVLEPLLGFEAQVYSYYAAAFLLPIGLLYRGIFLKTLKSSVLAVVRSFRRGEQTVPVDPSEQQWFKLGPAILVGCLLTALTHWGP